MVNPDDYSGTGGAERDTAAALVNAQDNFDRFTIHRITDLIDIPGEHDFSPERLRYYKDGTRRFLEYGSDANYSETAVGHLLDPDSAQTLTLKTAERVAYPVGLDLVASMARRVTQPPQAGDVVGGGYGVIDLANFDPATITYSGSLADGYFWYHTADTGLSSAVLAEVSGGTVLYNTTIPLPISADTLSIMEGELNWYAVGPAGWTLTYTDIENYPRDPQRNEFVGAVANDDGKGPERGSQRMVMAVHQAAGNSGLALEAGSLGTRAMGLPNYKFKLKGHSMDLENTNTTQGTYQVLGAIRTDDARPEVKARLPEFEIISTPGSSVTRTRVLMIAVDPAETNAEDAFPAAHADAVPVEHNPANSVIQEVEVAGDAATPLTGPVEDGAGTDVTGPDTAATMSNPGGWQLGRESVTPEGTGSKTTAFAGQQVGNRSIYDTDICLILVDAATAGTVEIDVQTEQNS